jgi:predicted phosphoadenosine phosphosulfate sulfurtransferase
LPKTRLGIDVLTAAQQRIEWTFDNFPRLYVSFSGGKDSTILLHLVAAEARKRGRRFGMLLVDLEGQYKCTIEHVERCYEMYADCADPYWVALPISLRNAVSVYEPKWLCWDPDKRDVWIREPHDSAITAPEHFPFFRPGMEFEEFVPEFGEWYARQTDDGEPQRTACLVGIRADESLNRFRTIASTSKTRLDDKQYTSLVTPNVYNVYPIYDWRTQDLWAWHGRNPDAPYNRLYDLMGMAGLTINQMRICQPYGDDQRRGLWLFHLIEPETWARVVARVNGANGGALYVQEWGNINGYRRVTKPPGHTWRSFAELLVKSMPPQMEEHYRNKILLFQKWWADRGYPDGIPEEADYQVEAKRLAPSWRRVCKSLLRNDYWCKGLGFTQHKSDAYRQYLDLMRRRREAWGVEDGQLEFVTEAGEVREEAMA